MNWAWLILLMLPSCVFNRLGPNEPVEPWMRTEWNLAQVNLGRLGVVGADRIHPEEFRWQAMQGPFTCGKTKLANGCYSPKSHRIQYNVQTPRVVRHEAGHAILHRLDLEWRCYEHGC